MDKEQNTNEIADVVITEQPPEVPLIFREDFWENGEVTDMWNEDRLSRKNAAKTFTKVISKFRSFNSENKSTTAVVKSPWGSGKTFFVKKLKETLEEGGCFCTYLSAWEAETYHTPSIYFIRKFLESLKKNEGIFAKLMELIQKGAFKITPLITSLATVAATATNPILGLFTGWLSNKASKACERDLKQIENIAEANLSIGEIKEIMDSLISPIASETPDNKIYVFIDELDRCKPSQTIDLIEVIKHYFSLENVVFILSVDLEQLQISIRHVYGQGMDTEGYLMRFVDLFYNLPTPNNFEYASYLKSHLFSLPDTLESVNYCQKEPIELIFDSIQESSSFSKIFSDLSTYFRSSLRDQQRIISRLNLMLLSGKVFLLPTVYLLFIQLKFPLFYIENVNKGFILSLGLDNLVRQFSPALSKQIPLESPLDTMLSDSLSLLAIKDSNKLIDEIDRKLRNYKTGLIGANGAAQKEKEKSRVKYAFIAKIKGNLKDFQLQIELLNLYLESFTFTPTITAYTYVCNSCKHRFSLNEQSTKAPQCPSCGDDKRKILLKTVTK